jgi:hypothetical protein
MQASIHKVKKIARPTVNNDSIKKTKRKEENREARKIKLSTKQVQSRPDQN